MSADIPSSKKKRAYAAGFIAGYVCKIVEWEKASMLQE